MTLPVRIARLAALLLIGIVVFAVALTAVYALPNEPIRENLTRSAEQLEAEGHPYAPFFGIISFRLDNFTDALMLDIALDPTPEGALKAGLGAYAPLTFDENGAMSPIVSLSQATAGTPGPVYSYARYWHGYQTLLRPSLLVMDYRGIRLLNVLVLGALIVLTTLVVRYRVGLGAAIALAAALLSIGIFFVPISLQFMGVVVISLLGVLAVSWLVEADGTVPFDWEIFLILGMLTAFFDLLTAPVLTLAMPLALLLAASIRSSSADRIGARFLSSVILCVIWASGYASTMAAKWLAASTILDHNLMQEVRELGSAHALVPGASPAYRVAVSIGANLEMLLHRIGTEPLRIPGVLAVVMAVLLLLGGIVAAVASRRLYRSDGSLGRLAGLLPAAMLPYLWYALLSGHSTEHAWFTYRSQAATVFSVLFALMYAIDPTVLRRWKSRTLGFVAGRTLASEEPRKSGSRRRGK